MCFAHVSFSRMGSDMYQTALQRGCANILSHWLHVRVCTSLHPGHYWIVSEFFHSFHFVDFKKTLMLGKVGAGGEGGNKG